MTWLDDQTNADLLEHKWEMRLFLEQKSPTQFNEVWAGGYTPQPLTPRIEGEDIVFEPAVWIFNGPAGTVRGYYVLVDGRIKHAESFDKPIVVNTSGSKIEVVARIELE